jgi:cobalt/nickel transport system ATP-binding protein
MNKIIEISCIEHIYPDKTKVEICGLEFTVNKGEKVVLLGPNGGGKTTLIKHILGILTPKSGSVKVFGVDPVKDFDKIRERMGVVLQSIEEQLIGPTVIEDIIFSPLNYGYSREKSLELADKIMDRLEIRHLKNKIIHYLSGGEKRKVALAGALILNPDLLILDEPFSALDYKSQKEFACLLNEITLEKQIGVVISTHDLELIADFADTVYLISSKDHLLKKGTPREIFYIDEEIEKYHLEKPNIVKIFNSLKSSGFDLGNPITADEAVKSLLNILNK